MKLKEFDPSQLHKVCGTLEGIANAKRAKGQAIDGMYYDLLRDHYKKLATCKEEGKQTAGYFTPVYAELLTSMDIIPMELAGPSYAIAHLLHNYDELFAASSAMGINPECCAQHRLFVGALSLGYLPRPDFVIGSRPYCDTSSIGDEFIAQMFQVPFFCVDRPFVYSDHAVDLCVAELKELVAFLEDGTGRKMDWDLLRQKVEWLRRVFELRREIAELRKAIPAPMKSRHAMYLELADFVYGGSPEAIRFYEAVRDEVKERVAKKEGVIPEEKYRLMLIFYVPTWDWKLIDLWESKYGAACATEMVSYSPEQVMVEGALDPDKPLHALAHRLYHGHVASMWYQPLDVLVNDVVYHAREYNVEAVVFYTSMSCPPTCAAVRVFKDTIEQKVGLPIYVIDADYADPSYVTGEQLREKTEEMFEMLAERKRIMAKR